MKETMKKLIEVFLICHFLISVAIGACGRIRSLKTFSCSAQSASGSYWSA